jgi:uncharacterized protein (TIGR02466 family)
MSKIITYFPTSFFIFEDLLSKEENKILLNKSNEIKNNSKKGGTNFLSQLYNTHGSFDLLNDSYFKKLINLVEDKTNEFAKEMFSNSKYNVLSSWLNFYHKNDFQEYHQHSDSIFSAVYIIKSEKNDCYLTFENPSNPYDMKKLKNINTYNELTFETVKFDISERSLIIFRSFLKHCVTPKIKESMRISAAFNLS